MMAPLISVLLPTVRPGLAERAIASVAGAAGRVPYEVVVVADFKPFYSDLPLVWVEQDRRGVVEAVNEACRWACGTHWFLFNDESTLEENALELLYLESNYHPQTLLGPRHDPAYQFVYFGREFVPFPFAHRDVFRKVGGLLDPAFKCFYADPDLSLRAHAVGVTVRTLDEAVIHHSNGHDEAKAQNMGRWMREDQQTFRARWSHLGEFRDC